MSKNTNRTSFNDYDAELSSLISVIEQWNLALNEINDLRNGLSKLPIDLIALKEHQQNLLLNHNIDSATLQTSMPSTVDVKNVIKYLDKASSKLIKLNIKTLNLVALRERVEAIQDNYKFVPSPNYNSELLRFKKPINNSIQAENKFKLINQIKIFKRQYPENFWSIIIAFSLMLVFSWKVAAPAPSALASPINNTEKSN